MNNEPSFPPQAETGIFFDSEDIDFQLEDEGLTTSWLEGLIRREHCRLHCLNFIFCADDYLLKLNIEYLQHDTLTDIITFPYAEPPEVEGDIFISVERIRDNAQTYQVSFEQELHRVMAHGVLHLCGYGDKTAAEATLMRKKENEALEYRDSL
ncbi:MAG: hypothetical protein RI973_1911 [Bacteroidota bacterium]|jgi:rRNA maturation RNase YbeY